MLPETNLDRVKSVAHTLLMTEIHKTEYSPMIVQHPFTNSGMVAANKDGVIQLVDITASEENLQAWQKYMTELINNAEKPYDIYMADRYGHKAIRPDASDICRIHSANAASLSKATPATTTKYKQNHMRESDKTGSLLFCNRRKR